GLLDGGPVRRIEADVALVIRQRRVGQYGLVDLRQRALGAVDLVVVVVGAEDLDAPDHGAAVFQGTGWLGVGVTRRNARAGTRARTLGPPAAAAATATGHDQRSRQRQRHQRSASSHPHLVTPPIRPR